MLRYFLQSPQPPFHLVVCPPSAQRDKLYSHAFVISPTFLRERMETQTRPIGTFNPKSCNRILQQLAWRVASLMARQATPSTTEQHAFAESWYFSLWTELCTLIPIRHFARCLAREIGDKITLIPLDSLTFDCCRYWNRNTLEPLFLAAELRRHGVNALLVYSPTNNEKHSAEHNLHITIRPGDSWRANGPAIHILSRSDFFIAEGIRNPEKVFSRIHSNFSSTSATTQQSLEHIPSLWNGHDQPAQLSIPLLCAGRSDWYELWTPRDEVPNLAMAFLDIFLSFTKNMWRNAQEIVSHTGASRAHICDHHFFTSALVAHATASAGGEVNVWPHASNAVHPAFRQPESVTCSTTITVSGAMSWKKYLTALKLRIDSSLMLTQPSQPRQTDAGMPIHVILFAGAHNLNLLPLMDIQKHTETWRKLLQELNRLPSDFKIVLKPKNGWEDLDWIRQFIEPESRINVTSTHASELDLPNMIFISVSLGTSALLEGLGRGIPCMIARPFEVEDYTQLDCTHFPIGDVDLIISSLRRCQDASFFEHMTSKQLAWFRSQTFFPAK